MAIRARNAIRSDAACHSADVLTPAERYVEQLQRKRLPRRSPAGGQLVVPCGSAVWGDVPRIREVLQALYQSA